MEKRVEINSQNIDEERYKEIIGYIRNDSLNEFSIEELEGLVEELKEHERITGTDVSDFKHAIEDEIDSRS